MPEISEAPVGVLNPAQATALALLVDLEARWENLREHPPRGQAEISLKDLSAKQKAYDAFRTRLAAYNKRYQPQHVPELLLNNPRRLGAWCRAMANLYLQAGGDTVVSCPVNLLDKAFRWADQIAVRMHVALASRPTPPTTIADAIKALESLVKWCEDLMQSSP